MEPERELELHFLSNAFKNLNSNLVTGFFSCTDMTHFEVVTDCVSSLAVYFDVM